MSTPIQQVLQTTELLESILLEAPPRDVLLSQRVSIFWKEVIETSPRLQQLLCFQPVEGPANQEPYASFANTLVEPIAANMHNIAWELLYGADYWRERRPQTRPEASWQRMVFSQPPTKMWRKERDNTGEWNRVCNGVTMQDYMVNVGATIIPGNHVTIEKLPDLGLKLRNHRQLRRLKLGIKPKSYAAVDNFWTKASKAWLS